MDGVSSAFRRLLGRGAAAERRILAAVPQAILTVDAAECLAFANPAAAAFLAEALGPERGDDIIGRSLHGALETIAADGGRVCVLCTALREAGDREGVATLRPGDWHLRYTCSSLVDRNVRIGVVITIEREATAAEIEQRVQTRIAREMQALLADVAHELNNPLTVVIASAGMLRDAAQNDETRRRVELIVEAADRCVGVIRTFRSSFSPPQTSQPIVAPAAAAPESTPAPRPLPRTQILVVDDDALVASAMAGVLAAEGHEVDTASDGVVALARVAKQRYDVILTDVRMPRLDGPGLYRELSRLRPELLSCVIFVTGDTLSPETRRFLKSVPAPCVRKPFEPRHLRAAVRRVLAGGDQRDIA